MTKQLGNHVARDFLEAFVGRIFAFTPTVVPGGFALGVAEANIRGYIPISGYFYHVNSYDTASDEADRLNEEFLGLSPEQGMDIILSSMQR